MADRIPIAKAAELLKVRPQQLYNLASKGKLETVKPAGAKSQHVDLELARQVLEAERNRPKKKGGRHLSWQALTEYLQKSKAKEVRLDVDKIRELVEAPKAKMEMLHYWDPYRASFNGQAPGLKAIRAAGFEIGNIRFAHSEFIGMVGASVITVRRNES